MEFVSTCKYVQLVSVVICQILGVLGDDVLKSVATRVTIEGTPPEASPVEAY